jgi:chaperonin cofactor prefoldin
MLQIQAAKAHLEGMLEELQTEVQTLQKEQDHHLATITQLQQHLQQQEETYTQQMSSLRHQLEGKC